MADLLPLLDATAAHPEFKREVSDYLRGGAVSRIELEGYAPRVKIERVLTQLFHSQPELTVERVVVRGRSGCSDFTGEVRVYAGEAEHRFEFTWCCAWKAREQGWKDCYGFWDQQRAAREFGWQCFERWEPVGTTANAALPA